MSITCLLRLIGLKFNPLPPQKSCFLVTKPTISLNSSVCYICTNAINMKIQNRQHTSTCTSAFCVFHFFPLIFLFLNISLHLVTADFNFSRSNVISQVLTKKYTYVSCVLMDFRSSNKLCGSYVTSNASQ